MKSARERAAEARALALRMRALQMKRTKSGNPRLTTRLETISHKRKEVSPKKKAVTSPKKKVLLKNKAATSPKKATSPQKKGRPSRKDASSSKKTVTPSRKKAESKKSGALATWLADDEEEEVQNMEAQVENVTGGLKLLSRGMVTMQRVSHRLTRGIKLTVEFNAKGQPFGKVAGEMQSYTGVLARTKIPISFNDWRTKKLDDEKQKIWETVEEAFVIPKECRRLVIASAASKWKDFKSKLTAKYIIPFLGEPEKLENPPDDYRFIKKPVWDIFVATRITDTFQELRQAQIEKRKENKYPHRMSRKGYANLEAELLKTISADQLDRAVLWVKARQDKNGNFKSREVEEAANEIKKLKEEQASGKLKVSGSDDVLNKALKKPEHPGRVRGVGGFTKPSTYFHLPKRTMNRVDEGVLKETLEALLAEQKAKWEEEKAKQFAEERALWKAELARLEAKLNRKELLVESPKAATPLHENGSGQGSCPRPHDNVANNNVGEVELNGVKKKLRLSYEDNNPIFQEDYLIVEPNQKLTSTTENDVRDFHVPRTSLNEKMAKHDETECGLAIGSVQNIVAYGKVVDVGVDTSKQLVHGVPLGKGNLHVTVTGSYNDNALIPIPVRDDIVTVADAKGSLVAWPRHLVVIPKPTQVPTTASLTHIPVRKGPHPQPTQQKRTRRTVQRPISKKRELDYFDDDEDLETLPPNLPLPLEDLCKWADTELKKERTINTTLGPEFLGHSRKVVVSRKDIYNMAHKQELSSDVLVCYMSYLHGELQKSEMLDMVAFVDPDFTGALGCGNPTDRAKFLSNRYKQGKVGQIFLVPHNNSKNWMLTVVIPSDDLVYLMDPFKRVAYDDEWKTVVNHSLKMFYGPKNKKSSRKETKWVKLPGIPQQKDHNTCGYYIMCFMKEIVEDKDLEYATKWGTKDTGRQYNTDDIDAVRAVWAKYVNGIPKHYFIDVEL